MCAHLHGGMPPPMVQSSGEWSLIQLESVSTGLQRPLVPADPDSQVEVLSHRNVLGKKNVILTLVSNYIIINNKRSCLNSSTGVPEIVEFSGNAVSQFLTPVF